MRKRRLTKTPGFFWQGTLIVLPVVLLAAVGLLSLRQDKALATQEAKERAQALADEASQRIWDRLTAVSPALLNPQVVAAPPVSSSFCLIQVDNQGNLLFPPPYTATPLPRPLDVAELNEQQADLWQAARAAEYDRQDPQAAAAAWRQFIEANPPGRFGPAAQFALGLALAKQDQWKRAFDTFGLVGRQYPNAIGESGLPLKPLADLQCLTLLIRLPPSGPVEGVSTDGNKEALSAAPRLDSSSTNRLPRPAIAESERPSRPEPAAAREELDVDAVCRDALEHPSMVTPLILEMAGQWQRQGSLPAELPTLFGRPFGSATNWPAVSTRRPPFFGRVTRSLGIFFG
jgi:tetratricopeptide (TPR) repeat protein